MYSNINSSQQDYALNQGKKFNDYQNDYLHIVGTQKLKLIEETSSPNLGFLEPMTGNTNPVEVENNKILDNLLKLETEFNATLALYTNQYQQYMNKVLDQANEVKAYARNNVRNSGGKFFYVNRFGVTRGYSQEAWAQKPSSCPHSVPTDDTIQAYNNLTNGMDYTPGQPCNLDGQIIQNEDGQLAWVDEKGQRHEYDSRETMEQTQKNGNCPGQINQVTNNIYNMFPTGSSMNANSNCNTPTFDQALYDAVNDSNQKLMNIANEMYQQAITLDKTSKEVENKSNSMQDQLVTQIRSLNEERERIIKLKSNTSTLDGDIEDDGIIANMEVARYVGLGIAALAIGGITLHLMTKK